MDGGFVVRPVLRIFEALERWAIIEGMNKKNGIPDADLILFDLDNTIYPKDLGLWRLIDGRIRAYVSRELNLSPEEAAVVQKRYWQLYGTTIIGLMNEHDVDPEPYLAYVHDVDVGKHLSPNAELQQVLSALPQRKAIFTNATAAHARNVLSAMGILDHFDPLVGMHETHYISKPDPRAFSYCLALLDVPAHRCLFIEDSPVNLPPARDMGMATVLVGRPDQGEADYYIDRIEDIAQLFGLD